MKKISLLCGTILLVPFAWLAFAAAEQIWHTWTYRHRLTVAFNMDGRLYVGASVRQSRVTRKSGLLPQTGGVSTSLSGEAVTIDLGDRGYVFALLRDIERPFVSSGMWLASADEIVQSSFPRIKGEEGEQGLGPSLQRYARGGEKRELNPEQLPMLIRFRDINDPKSVEQVDPSTPSATLGPGVHFAWATIETVPMGLCRYCPANWSWPQWLVGVPVTKMIQTALPWLTAIRGKRLVAATGRSDTPVFQQVTYSDLVDD